MVILDLSFVFLDNIQLILWLKILSKGKRQLLYWVTQKNSIEFQVQDSLPYIQVMVHEGLLGSPAAQDFPDSSSDFHDVALRH